jgi:hypothetical protein
MNNDLVPEHRADKNGVLSTKWVRPVQFTDAHSVAFPVPAVTDPQNEIKRLSAEIMSHYKAAGFGENFARINERAVQRIVDAGNLVLLEVIAKVAADKPMSVNQIISHLEEMRDAGIENPESQITAARIASCNKVWSVLNDRDAKGRMSGGNWEVLQLILVADDDDREMLEDIVVKRGATSHDEVIAMFTLLKGAERPLVAGAL